MFCDYQIFWFRHFKRPYLVDELNACNHRKTWNFWVEWFGLNPVIGPLDNAIENMKSRAAELRNNSKKSWKGV